MAELQVKAHLSPNSTLERGRGPETHLFPPLYGPTCVRGQNVGPQHTRRSWCQGLESRAGLALPSPQGTHRGAGDREALASWAPRLPSHPGILGGRPWSPLCLIPPEGACVCA